MHELVARWHRLGNCVCAAIHENASLRSASAAGLVLCVGGAGLGHDLINFELGSQFVRLLESGRIDGALGLASGRSAAAALKPASWPLPAGRDARLVVGVALVVAAGLADNRRGLQRCLVAQVWGEEPHAGGH